MNCFQCGRPLDADDIGAYRKFWDRNAEAFLCVPCFCQVLKCEEAYLRDRIRFLRENGCRLFPENGNTKTHE